MHRVLVPPHAVQRDRVIVSDPDRLHHLRHVLRVSTGDALECCDGQGHSYTGRILTHSARALVVQLDAALPEPPVVLPVTLAVSLIKLDRFEWMVEKATELGVDRLLPLVTARTVIRPSPAQAERRVERWRRIIREAAQQCGRRRLPEIEAPQPFERAIAGFAQDACMLMPTLAGQTVPLRDALAGLAQRGSAAILIGPEGDFTPEEARLAAGRGATLVSLGALTLRSETAALATLAAVRYAAGTFG